MHNLKVLTFLLLLLTLGCQKKSQLEVNDDFFQPGAIQGKIDSTKLQEASGLAGSITNPGLIWTHNDGGDEARVFLIDEHANLKATVKLDSVKNRDWEDIAAGPGPVEGKSYIYVGDIGDNKADHKFKFIYRVEEPTANWDQVHDTTLFNVDRIKFQLPDGPRDSESLMIDPLTRDLYIISKREEKVNLYRLPYPQSTTEEITAELSVAKLEFNQYGEKFASEKDGQKLINGNHSDYYNQIVGCDMSKDGNELLIKSYSSVYYWKRNQNETVAEMIKRKPVRLPYLPEPQGEAITFDVTGTGYFTLNEKLGKNPQQLIFYKRK